MIKASLVGSKLDGFSQRHKAEAKAKAKAYFHGQDVVIIPDTNQVVYNVCAAAPQPQTPHRI